MIPALFDKRIKRKPVDVRHLYEALSAPLPSVLEKIDSLRASKERPTQRLLAKMDETFRTQRELAREIEDLRDHRPPAQIGPVRR